MRAYEINPVIHIGYVNRESFLSPWPEDIHVGSKLSQSITHVAMGHKIGLSPKTIFTPDSFIL